MRLLVLLLLVSAVHGVAAETPPHGTVAGRIVEHGSSRPVEYAAVVLKDANGKVIQRAATNAKGEFVLESVPTGDYQLAYSLVGGEPQEPVGIHLDAQHDKANLGTLELRGETLQMQRVDVAARREAFYNSIDRKTYTVGQDLKSVSGSASDLLQGIPSVQVDVDGNVSLRGNGSVLILVDGKPSTLMSTANRPDVLAQMSADDIERVEVITNPSAKYKPDGTAGILNLVMKRRHVAGSSGTIRVSVGNERRGNFGLSLNRAVGKLNVLASASVRQDDRSRSGTERRSHLDATSQTFVSTEQDSFEQMRPLSRLAQLGFDYRLSDADKIGASASYNYRTFFRDALVVSRSRNATGIVTADYDRRRTDAEWQKTTEVKASYSHAFADDGHELSLEAKRDRHWEQEDNVYANVFRAPATPTGRDATLIKPTETGTEITADYTRPFPHDAKLEAGYAHETNKNDMDFRGSLFDSARGAWLVDATRTNRFIYRDTIQALYATFARPFGKFGFLAGLRLEDTVVHTNQATARLVERTAYRRLHPSLHLSYNLTETRQLQLNYSHRVHRPESDDLNPFPEYQDPFNLRAGNPRLRPEETHSLETGYQYHQDDTTYLAALFFRDTYHAFTTVTRYIDAVTLLTTHENLAGNRSGGLELAATKELGTKVFVNFSANAFRSAIDAANLGFSGQRSALAWDAKMNLKWRVTKSDTLQLDTHYTARRLTAQGYRLPAAFANVGWRHDFKARKYALTLTVSDVFDSLKEHTVIDTPTLHDDITRRRSSRIVYAGFTYNFGAPAKKEKKDELQFDTSL